LSSSGAASAWRSGSSLACRRGLLTAGSVWCRKRDVRLGVVKGVGAGVLVVVFKRGCKCAAERLLFGVSVRAAFEDYSIACNMAGGSARGCGGKGGDEGAVCRSVCRGGGVGGASGGGPASAAESQSVFDGLLDAHAAPKPPAG